MILLMIAYGEVRSQTLGKDFPRTRADITKAKLSTLFSLLGYSSAFTLLTFTFLAAILLSDVRHQLSK